MGGGGEESGVNVPSAKKFFIAALLLCYSVIYNSVNVMYCGRHQQLDVVAITRTCIVVGYSRTLVSLLLANHAEIAQIQIQDQVIIKTDFSFIQL